MSSNFSQRKRRSEVLSQPIGHFRRWSFELHCPSCRDRRLLKVEDLLVNYADHHPMSSVVNRLRCSVATCRRPPSFLKLVGPSTGRSGQPDQEVMLIGPGAYQSNEPR